VSFAVAACPNGEPYLIKEWTGQPNVFAGAFEAHPTRHNKNLSPLIEGPVIQVAPVHAKIRRDGYRSQKTAGNGAGSEGTSPSSAPASPDQPEEAGLDGVGGGER
jgi:hypothetical protein